MLPIYQELWCDSTQLVCGVMTVLALFYFVWIFNWAKGTLGNSGVALTFAVIIIYLTAWLHPWLIWIPAAIYLLNHGGKDVLGDLFSWGTHKHDKGGSHGGDHGHH